jgi:Tol biopolymer transport system component
VRRPALVGLVIGGVILVSGGTANSRPESALARNGLIAFERFVSNGTSAVYTMNANGGKLRRVTRHVPPLGPPVWSPQGTIGYAGGVGGRLMEVNPQNGRARLLEGRARIRSTGERFAWGRDGRLVVQLGHGLEIRKRGGALERRLTRDEYDDFPAWSPDGRQIAFERSGDVYVVGSNGRGLRKLASGNSPAWSPDGTRLVFSACCDRELFAINLDGSGRRLLARNASQPAWSPDGRKIAFVRFLRGGNSEIFVMNADGSNQKRLTRNPAIDAAPDWQRR